MRLFWLLPKAAPALLRHLAAYAELAGLDFARAHREFSARLVSLAVLVICGLFTAFLAVLTVIALTWDTPYRVPAVATMGGAFLLAALIAAVYAFRLSSRQTPFLATLRREWDADRVLLEHLMAAEEE